jgi:transposase
MAPNGTLEDKVESLIECKRALTLENKILRDQLDILKKGLFGRKSERIDSGQMDFLKSEETQDVAPPEAPEAKPKKKPGHGSAKFAANIPRDVTKVDLAEADKICPCCGKAMKLIGEEVTERGHLVPARVIVKRYVRPKYACPDGHTIKTAPLPDGVIDDGKYEASVYAHIATAKYSDHLPLNRLEGIFKRHGFHLAKQSMWYMLVRVDELVAQPVLKQMRTELLAEPVLHADETPVTMRLEDGKGS